MRARNLGWPEELIDRMDASVLKDATAVNMTLLKIDADRAAKFLDMVERDPDRMANISLRFIQTKSELGIRAKPGPYGLGTPEINIGSYGQAPDFWPYENDTPLGSHPGSDNVAPGSYTIYDKSELWAEGVDHMYEEAIRERWAPATDLDWTEGLKTLPEDVERAVCQLATIYSSHGLVEQKIISKWLEQMSYGYHDVKLFLGTQVYDAGHKVEALRKRALANGGGLGQAPLGTLYRGFYGALKWTEVVTVLDIVYKSYELTLFEAAKDIAKTPLEEQMYDLMAKDSRRHLEYGKRHLVWYMQHHKNGHNNVAHFLGRGETNLSNELRHSHVEREALVVLMGNGAKNAAAGIEKLRKLRQQQLRNYIDLLDSIGIDRTPFLNPGLVKITEDPLYV
jgi:hypothetical protein